MQGRGGGSGARTVHYKITKLERNSMETLVGFIAVVAVFTVLFIIGHVVNYYTGDVRTRPSSLYQLDGDFFMEVFSSVITGFQVAVCLGFVLVAVFAILAFFNSIGTSILG